MQNDYERRCLKNPIKYNKRDDGSVMITGYAALFNSLSENLGGFKEIIRPGAFNDSMENDVRALIDHESGKIIGRLSAGTLRIMQDEMGLKYEVDVPDTSHGRDLIISLGREDITGSSFGFMIGMQQWMAEKTEDGLPIREIVNVSELIDVGPVTFPAYPDTSVALRSLNESRQNSIRVKILKRKLELLSLI